MLGVPASVSVIVSCHVTRFMNRHSNPNLAMILHYIFKMLHPIGGIIFGCLGYSLFIKGVTGNASLIINAKDFKGQLLNASPGLFTIICGGVVLLYSVRKGAAVGLKPGKHGTAMMANESAVGNDAHDTEEQSNSNEGNAKGKSALNTITTKEVIGPQVSWDYKKGKPNDI